GRRARVLGWHATWTERGDPARPWTYSGALTLTDDRVPDPVRAALPAALERLVAATGLAGLCGIDLCVDGPRWWLIEINPRPTATAELHERDPGLLTLHRAAVTGVLPAVPAPLAGCRGQAVVYAGRPLRVVPFAWPDWTADRPVPGSRIASGQPLCTLTAAGDRPRAVRVVLARRRHQLREILHSWPRP
ncbi:MAG: ATP-grasp domain-containing protein, partial [Candidatus Competibacterales bacterium]|nr:ATP-grasp domain-containing protein [Candidatus Competibacterales bacterium]